MSLDDIPPPTRKWSLDDVPPPPKVERSNPASEGGTLSVGPWDTGIKTPPWADNALAGVGKAYADIGRGVRTRAMQVADAFNPRQTKLTDLVVGKKSRADESRAEIEESRRLDAPLMDTTAGKVGNFAGNVALAAPTAYIPGANTVAGGAAVGAGMGLLQPSTSGKETAANVGLGGAGGGVGAWVGGKVAQWAAGRQAGRQAVGQADAALNAERDAVLARGREAGYVVPPTAINPSATNTALESVSGKAATRQSATAANQRVTNNLVRQDLGLPQNAPLTHDALEAVRRREGQVYDQVSRAGQVNSDHQYINDLQAALTGSPHLNNAYPGIGGQADQRLGDLVNSVMVADHDASGLVEGVKYIRNQAKSNFKSAFASGNPDALTLARGQQEVADAMESLLTRHLHANGQGDLAQAWENARRTIAKAHSAEAALNGGNVSAAHLAQQARKGKPMSGGMDLAARFGDHFGDVAGLPKSGAGVSKLAATAATASELGAAYLHSPGLAVGGAAAALSPYAVRAGMLSGAGQRVLATPNYAPGALGSGTLNTLEFLGRNGARTGAMPLRELMSGGQ